MLRNPSPMSRAAVMAGAGALVLALAGCDRVPKPKAQETPAPAVPAAPAASPAPPQ